MKHLNNNQQNLAKHTPTNVGISITNYCSLTCKHCFNSSGPSEKLELPINSIVEILDTMVTWNLKTIRITGGEPTSHSMFKQFIYLAQDRNIAVTMNSNGVYEPLLLKFLKTAPINFFLISIDGLQKANDEVRGKGTFKRIIHSCESLKLSGKDINLSCHLNKQNKDQIGGLAQLAEELEIDLKISAIRPIGRARSNMQNIILDASDCYEIASYLNELREKHSSIHIRSDFDLLENILKNKNFHPAVKRCKASDSMININYDGEIYPCLFLANDKKIFSGGNINEISLLNAWKHSKVFKLFRDYKKNEKCQQCEFYGLKCVGGCPAVSYYSSGDIAAADPMCFAHLI